MSERIMLERPQTGVLPGQNDPPQTTQEPPQAPAPEPQATTPPAPETPPATTGEPPAATPPPEPTQEDWQRRVDQLTREKWEARRLAEDAARRAGDLERQVRQPAPPTQQPGAYGPPPAGETPQAAEERAYQRFRNEQTQNQFNEACNTLYAKGREEFGPGMDEAVRGLNAVGWGNRPDALAALTQLPDGHRVYHTLAGNLDNAARVLAMPPMAMAMELARMSIGGPAPAAAAPPPATVTRAPEPIRTVGGATRPAPKSLDQMTTAEFIRQRDRGEVGSQRIRR